MQRALAAFDREEFGKAAGEARRAKEAAPRSPSVREALGLIYHARKEFKEALGELQTFRRLSGSPLQDATIADCYRELGRPEKALEVVMSLKRESVDEQAWIEAQVIRARAHESRGNVDAAVGVLRTLDADGQISEGNHLRARYELAELLERAGERGEARMVFAKIAVKAPGYRDALKRAR